MNNLDIVDLSLTYSKKANYETNNKYYLQLKIFYNSTYSGY